jgi:hypothetical protein
MYRSSALSISTNSTLRRPKYRLLFLNSLSRSVFLRVLFSVRAILYARLACACVLPLYVLTQTLKDRPRDADVNRTAPTNT